LWDRECYFEYVRPGQAKPKILPYPRSRVAISTEILYAKKRGASRLLMLVLMLVLMALFLRTQTHQAAAFIEPQFVHEPWSSLDQNLPSAFNSSLHSYSVSDPSVSLPSIAPVRRHCWHVANGATQPRQTLTQHRHIISNLYLSRYPEHPDEDHWALCPLWSVG
ncbi:hypothetical protein BDZ97DRAFT_1862015, partial [Flammula alnicola]